MCWKFLFSLFGHFRCAVKIENGREQHLSAIAAAAPGHSWSPLADLSRVPPGYDAGAHPIELRGLVARAGIEPA